MRKAGKKFQIIGGERRWTAISKVLKRKTIKAIVRSKGTAFEMLADNMVREELLLVERMDAIVSILAQRFGADWKSILQQVHSNYKANTVLHDKMRSICKSVGMHPSTIYLYLPVVELSKKIKSKILKHPDFFPDSLVVKMARLRDDRLSEKAVDCIISKSYDSRRAMSYVSRLAFGEAEGKVLFLIENLNKSAFSLSGYCSKILDVSDIPYGHKASLLKRLKRVRVIALDAIRHIEGV